jgi:hypothetical protein
VPMYTHVLFSASPIVPDTGASCQGWQLLMLMFECLIVKQRRCSCLQVKESMSATAIRHYSLQQGCY